MKHTKGNWQIMWGNYTHYATINSNITKRICTVDLSEGYTPIDEARANVKLIAAAPDMLQKLIELKKELSEIKLNKIQDICNEITEVIKKATE